MPSIAGIGQRGEPAAMRMSRKFNVTARIRTRTEPGPGIGLGTVSRVRLFSLLRAR
jgi:hypothetical protein